MAVTRARCDPQTRDYIARKKAEGKTNRDAIRSLKRHLDFPRFGGHGVIRRWR